MNKYSLQHSVKLQRSTLLTPKKTSYFWHQKIFISVQSLWWENFKLSMDVPFFGSHGRAEHSWSSGCPWEDPALTDWGLYSGAGRMCACLQKSGWLCPLSPLPQCSRTLLRGLHSHCHSLCPCTHMATNYTFIGAHYIFLSLLIMMYLSNFWSFW